MESLKKSVSSGFKKLSDLFTAKKQADIGAKKQAGELGGLKKQIQDIKKQAALKKQSADVLKKNAEFKKQLSEGVKKQAAEFKKMAEFKKQASELKKMAEFKKQAELKKMANLKKQADLKKMANLKKMSDLKKQSLLAKKQAPVFKKQATPFLKKQTYLAKKQAPLKKQAAFKKQTNLKKGILKKSSNLKKGAFKKGSFKKFNGKKKMAGRKKMAQSVSNLNKIRKSLIGDDDDVDMFSNGDKWDNEWNDAETEKEEWTPDMENEAQPEVQELTLEDIAKIEDDESAMLKAEMERIAEELGVDMSGMEEDDDIQPRSSGLNGGFDGDFSFEGLEGDGLDEDGDFQGMDMNSMFENLNLLGDLDVDTGLEGDPTSAINDAFDFGFKRANAGANAIQAGDLVQEFAEIPALPSAEDYADLSPKDMVIAMAQDRQDRYNQLKEIGWFNVHHILPSTGNKRARGKLYKYFHNGRDNLPGFPSQEFGQNIALLGKQDLIELAFLGKRWHTAILGALMINKEGPDLDDLNFYNMAIALDQYGCHCSPHSLHGEGYYTGTRGQNLDQLDEACHARNSCYRCIKMEEPNCYFWQKYKYAVDLKEGEMRCTDPLGSCGRNLCECDKQFIMRRVEFQATYNSAFAFVNGFTLNFGSCEASDRTQPGKYDTCCGPLGHRKPISVSTGHGCCGNEVPFNMQRKDCCTVDLGAGDLSYVVKDLGQCDATDIL